MQDLLGKRRIAPSQISHAPRARTFPAPIGPTGIAIPDRRSAFRPSDHGLLREIMRAASAWQLDQRLPAAEQHRVACELVALLDERYPAADMVVLQRYGFARPFAVIFAQAGQHGEAPWKASLAEPRLLPECANGFDFRDPAAIPPSLRDFFADLVRIHAHRSEATSRSSGWTAGFRHDHKRAPTWAEIEREFPVIGDWLAAQREAMA